MATSIKISQLPQLSEPATSSLAVMVDSGITHFITANDLFNNGLDISSNTIHATNNNNGTNFRVGDDAWIGDVNIANTIQISGIETPYEGYIKFGSGSNTPRIGTTGNSDLIIENAWIQADGIELNYNILANGDVSASKIYATELFRLDPQDSLPYGEVGFIAVSSSHLYFHNDSSWNRIDVDADTNYATTGSNTFNGTQIITGSLFISGTTELGGNIVPKSARGASLGTVDRPFGDIFVSSGSINIAGIIGQPNTALSNVSGNILISAGGMQLLGSGSFNATTASFSYLSGSVRQFGDYTLFGNKTITGSLYVSGTIVDTDRMVIGDVKGDDNNITVAGTEYNSQLVISNYGSDYVGQLILHRHSTEIQPILVSARSNSDDDTDTDVTPGMALLQIAATGWAGTDYKEFANIVFSADDADGITIDDGSSPGKIDFNVSPDGDVHTNNALTLRSNLNAEFNGLIKANGIVLGANYPTTSKGQAGDLNGMIASDGNYIYYCFEDYISGTNNIWKRVQLSNSSW